MSDVVTVNKEGVTVALRTFALNLKQRNELMGIIGKGQLVSIYRTFDEQGSPAGSWVPLSPNTIARNPKKYGSGHKLLIDKGILRNGFHVVTTSTGVVISNNVKYAAVQNFGSADLVAPAAGIGPSNRDSSKAVQINAHGYRRLQARRKGKTVIVGKDGKQRTVNKLFAGPLNKIGVEVSAHSRHQNIPARPFMVFRPEDQPRIEKQVATWIDAQRAKSGLAGA